MEGLEINVSDRTKVLIDETIIEASSEAIKRMKAEPNFFLLIHWMDLFILCLMMQVFLHGNLNYKIQSVKLNVHLDEAYF